MVRVLDQHKMNPAVSLLCFAFECELLLLIDSFPAWFLWLFACVCMCVFKRGKNTILGKAEDLRGVRKGERMIKIYF